MPEDFKPTNARVRRGIQDIASGKAGAYGIESDSGSNGGVRDAKLSKIDLKNIMEHGWYVEFKDGSKAKVATSADLGIEYLPDGKVKKGYLYPKDETWVKVVVDASGKVSHIMSTPLTEQVNSTPVGATRIARGNGEIVVGQENLKLSTKDSTITIVDGEIRINATKIYINDKLIE